MKVRTQARQEAIVEAAATLFQEFGYEGASMNELSKRLGGSKTTLYGYFPSKEVLFMAVIRSFATQHLSEAVQALPTTVDDEAELKAVLLRFAQGLLRVVTNDAAAIAINRMVIAEAGRSEVGELFYKAGPRESVAALAKLLAAAMDRQLLRRGDPEVNARQLMALTTAEVTQRMYQRNPLPMTIPAIRKIAQRAVEMYLAGAAPH
jgi:AcrR family transcriptional regulator